ncbi:cyclic nucleotide-binding domain-containing protein [Streptomyces sp. SID13666]|uniref:Crp/Fnr family transcriptional regulator n=1 Tax=unclassified Streptomyces TaxID=2593676 RepID=UPI0013C09E79|nr:MULTISPECIES: cyclic nucleotide-binding domain-containing protein [unclassified Streptomyces]NEA54709.1 cyclic nucleotide-binding domain-containing protein [Streptomyces sp. SID13666]NEA70498.1 cyclic nucleotide-binding domain-containing protein [Streptomyces sp. SID13588]
MSMTHSILDTLTTAHRDRLMALSRPVAFPAGARIFDADQAAERFWVLDRGEVNLDLHVPGRQAAVVQTVSAGELLGWSWLFPPFRWQLGAQAHTAVRATEFPAAAVRDLCSADPALGHEFVLLCAAVIGDRLNATRTRLLDLYGPFGVNHGASVSVGGPEDDS